MVAKLEGRRFGRLVAQEVVGKAANGRHNLWRCLCDCGRTADVSVGSLRSEGQGGVRSCGCLAADVTRARSVTHGRSRTKTWNVWTQLRRRCREKEGYADRGITVCERWSSFENFLADMGECPPGLTIERKDNDGAYEPGNCVWGTPKQQANNRRSSRLVTHDGRTQSVTAWAEELGIKRITLQWRIGQGWPAERAFKK